MALLTLLLTTKCRQAIQSFFCSSSLTDNFGSFFHQTSNSAVHRLPMYISPTAKVAPVTAIAFD